MNKKCCSFKWGFANRLCLKEEESILRYVKNMKKYTTNIKKHVENMNISSYCFIFCSYVHHISSYFFIFLHFTFKYPLYRGTGIWKIPSSPRSPRDLEKFWALPFIEALRFEKYRAFLFLEAQGLGKIPNCPSLKRLQDSEKFWPFPICKRENSYQLF